MPTFKTNYVKFQRGLISAYEKLAVKDADTLYFIYEKADAKEGKLYLGDKLISSSASSENLSESLLQLNEVLSEVPGAGSFLVANSEGKWEVRSTEEVASLLGTNLGQTLQVEEEVFTFTDGTLSLNGFADAVDGSFLTKVDGELTWATNDFASRINDLEDSVGDLEALLNDLNGINYVKKDTYEEAAADAKANTIYLIPSANVEGNKYKEYIVVDGKLEQLGQIDLGNIDLNDFIRTDEIGAILADYVTTSSLTSILGDYVTVGDLDDILSDYVSTGDLEAVVGNIEDIYNYNTDAPTTLVQEINNLYERLTWSEIEE